MPVIQTLLRPRTARIATLSDDAVVVSWDLNGYPDSPPFIQGRTEIVSVTQGFGKIVWRLEKPDD